MSWMQRLKRVFHIDIEHCGVCGGTLRVIACIETPLKCRSRSELAIPTSPTQRELCRFSLSSTTQVIELLESCTPNSPQYRL